MSSNSPPTRHCQAINSKSTRSVCQQSYSTRALPVAHWLASDVIFFLRQPPTALSAHLAPHFHQLGKVTSQLPVFEQSSEDLHTHTGTKIEKIQTGASLWLGIVSFDTWLFLHSAQSHPFSAHLLHPLCSHPVTFARLTLCWVRRWSTDSYRGNFTFRPESGTCTNTNQNRLSHPRMAQ